MSWTLRQAARATPVLAKDRDQRPEGERTLGSPFWALSTPPHHVNHATPPLFCREHGTAWHLESPVTWTPLSLLGQKGHHCPFWGGPPALLRREPSPGLLHRDSGELGRLAVCQARSPAPHELTPDSVLNAALLPWRPYGEFVTRALCSSGNR